MKRKGPSTSIGPSAKQQQLDLNFDSKEELNRLSRDSDLPVPVYSSIYSNGLYSSTVQYDGNTFHSIGANSDWKLSEQSAAHVALFVLGGVQTAPQGYSY